MTTNISNQVAYLRTSRDFPEEFGMLLLELDKSYIDIANCINARTIGLFTTNKAAITGESWFFDKNKRQQSLRQAFFLHLQLLSLTI